MKKPKIPSISTPSIGANIPKIGNTTTTPSKPISHSTSNNIRRSKSPIIEDISSNTGTKVGQNDELNERKRRHKNLDDDISSGVRPIGKPYVKKGRPVGLFAKDDSTNNSSMIDRKYASDLSKEEEKNTSTSRRLIKKAQTKRRRLAKQRIRYHNAQYGTSFRYEDFKNAGYDDDEIRFKRYRRNFEEDVEFRTLREDDVALQSFLEEIENFRDYRTNESVDYIVDAVRRIMHDLGTIDEDGVVHYDAAIYAYKRYKEEYDNLSIRELLYDSYGNVSAHAEVFVRKFLDYAENYYDQYSNTSKLDELIHAKNYLLSARAEYGVSSYLYDDDIPYYRRRDIGDEED